ncbi:uncharacterized protein LOC118803140 isoform X1 [Colossoma macropomum]|uniref:uncharacterized protein LOC118803140 isoform X1 n=1 Tax=Colossoma macropomum TaxID=42526 RepID=UPI001864C332|nr:uncharacterized protein LOC118803140 isoform X1 [Colossoma macropomum]
MEEPFERIILDCVGPLPRTKSGNRFLLTIMCAATRFPEAIPIRTLRAKAIIKALIKFCSTFGLPKCIQTDQGSNCMSKIFAQVLQQLSVKHKVSSAYHPESQGALERFHQTFKSMLRKYCAESGNEWDEGVPLVLFAIRETVQESTLFSPAQLVFGHSVRGPLKILKEKWMSESEPNQNVLDYVSQFRERLHAACTAAKSTLTTSQSTMKRRFDKRTVLRSFQPGDDVLVLLPLVGSSLQARFSGPYRIESKLSDTDYVIRTPDRSRKTRVCHINMLKTYVSREESTSDDLKQVSSDNSGFSLPVASVSVFSSSGVDDDDDDDDDDDNGLDACLAPALCARLSNSSILSDLSSFLSDLAVSDQQEMVNLIAEFPNLFSDVPRRTHVIEHDIDVDGHAPIKQNSYRINPTKRAIMKSEVQYLLDNGLAIPSFSPWSSPCLLVPKPDGTSRFCTDYRKVNAVTRSDSFPLPRIDDCVDRVGSAKYVSKLDLLKGYWQVPLTARASDISAFVTPDSFLQYTVMAFGMKNAPATFQRLMNQVLFDVSHCEAYLDDVIIYTETWDEHLSVLRTIFQRLDAASLTLNLAKCEFGKATVVYLGKEVGQGKVRPVNAKVATIQEFPVPSTKRELRRFLGMAGYYRSFCRNCACIASPLTDI